MQKMTITYWAFVYDTKQTNKQMKKLNKKYADLMRQAQQATGRKEAVGLIHKAANLKNKFDQYEMI